jgi:hypothetical protein
MLSNRLVFLATVILLLVPFADARAGRFDELLETLLKKPLRGVDNLDQPLLRHVDVKKIASPTKLGDDELLRQFERLEGVNGELRDAFKKLSGSERAALVELVSAGQRVARGHNPVDAVALIRKLDGDGLIQGRTYGDFVYLGVDKMGPEYKSVVAKMGEGAGVFFNKVINPHWEKWTAAGLAVAYLAAPEKFHDSLGQLTEYAVQKLTEAGIRTGESVTGGLAKALIARVEANPVFSLLTLALLVFALLVQVPLFRGFVMRRLLKPLWKVPSDAESRTVTTPRSDYEE